MHNPTTTNTKPSTAEKKVFRESAIERDLRLKAKSYNIDCYNFTSGTKGVPDRVLIGKHLKTGKGITAFVELKRPGKLPRPSQQIIIKRMVNRGGIVAVSDSITANDQVLHNIYGVPLPTTNQQNN